MDGHCATVLKVLPGKAWNVMSLQKQQLALTKERILISSLTAIALFFAWTGFLWRVFSCGFAGSYTCAESWDLKVKEKDLVGIMKEIKREHPELQPPDTSLTDGQESYWYHVLFYYADTKEIVDTWIRADLDSSVTTSHLSVYRLLK